MSSQGGVIHHSQHKPGDARQGCRHRVCMMLWESMVVQKQAEEGAPPSPPSAHRLSLRWHVPMSRKALCSPQAGGGPLQDHTEDPQPQPRWSKWALEIPAASINPKPRETRLLSSALVFLKKTHPLSHHSKLRDAFPPLRLFWRFPERKARDTGLQHDFFDKPTDFTQLCAHTLCLMVPAPPLPSGVSKHFPISQVRA